MARVEFEHVTKIYPGGVTAVDGVDLSISDQEFVVLVGPSGCGKSTTLRMVAGLEEITGGRIRIGGEVVNHLPPKNRNIAMVFQNYALYPHMTVYKNMAFGLKLRKVPRAEIHARVMEAARILDIEPLLDRKPKALSGGQRQRVAVGRAIVREPAAFLFDEPLSNLDARLRVVTRAELKRLHQRLKTTTIYVTHDQEEAMTLGDRIVVMKDGRIQQVDTPLNSYNVPANRFVAGFIGMPPMNFFDGMIRRVGERLVFEEAEPVDPMASAGDVRVSGSGFRVPVPTHLMEALSPHVEKHVVLGIRPEHFHLRGTDGGDWARITASISVMEPLGNNMDLYLDFPLHKHAIARVEVRNGLQVGLRVDLHVDLQKIHFFQPGDTGMNLSLTSEPAHAIA